VFLRWYRALTSVFVFLLCACGGGGGGGSTPGGPPPTSAPATGNASFVLSKDASSSITGAKRTPRYVSPFTASIAIVVNGGGTATILNIGDPAYCDAAGKCTITLSAPAGNVSFLVSAYDLPGATGKLLSRATVQATIAGGGTTVVQAVLDGYVASMTVSLANPNPTLHQPLTDAITVVAKDARSNTIVGPGGYLNPITLTNSDTSGHTSLTKSVLNGPGDASSLQYDGGYAAGTITASAQDVQTFGNPPSAQFFPKIAATETPLTAGRTARGLVVGPDGALWFAESPGYLGRITTSGALSESAIPGNWNMFVLCAGPDGALWMSGQNMVTGNSAILRRAPDGTYSTYTLATGYQVEHLVVGADGNLWFNQTGKLGQITPAGVITMMNLTDANTNPLHLNSLVAGPDNALWFGEDGYDALDRFDLTTRSVTMHLVRPLISGNPFPAVPATIIVGPDKRLYFSVSVAPLMSSDTAGTFAPVYSQAVTVGYTPLAFASDGALWFTFPSLLAGNASFGRALGGNEVPLIGSALQPGVFVSPDSMVTGPDGALWYARGNAIGRMVP
jgi:streptogramin lyase